MISNCNNSGLEPYLPSADNPWDRKKVKHLYRRLGFSETYTNVNAALSLNPSQLIDQLIDDAIVSPLTDLPNDDYIENTTSSTVRRDWINTHMGLFLENGVRERMMLFWSNHFVTVFNDYGRRTMYLYNYTRTLQEFSFGNFKDFVRKVGLLDAMLVYLNGYDNKNTSPNENYARELYELFTLGESNGYTEEDIEETARALTGYNENEGDRTTPIIFVPNNFDDGDKTIFGRTGNWGYDDVIDILFEEKEELIAKFIVEKIYKKFVNPDLPTNTNFIDGLAFTFRENDFELAPMLRQLFKSEHFFDEASIDVHIKGPIEHILTLHKEANFRDPSDNTKNNYNNDSFALGQFLFNPPDVSGWQGDRDWINAPNFINTWEILQSYLTQEYQADEENFRELALGIAGDNNDVEYVCKSIVDWFLPSKLLVEQDYANALDVFKTNVPDSYFEDGTWTLRGYSEVPFQMRWLINYIIEQPEFYLK